jgi:integrase
MLDITSLRLRAWYLEHFAPMFHDDARPRTIELYLTTIKHWESITGNPPLVTITQVELAQFRTGLKCGAATKAKHCRILNAMFAKLGPPGPHNRDALGLLPSSLWCRPPRIPKRTHAIPRDDQIDNLMHIAPPNLQLFLVTAALTGSRQTAIRALKPTSLDARGQLIHFPADTDKTGQERIKPIPQVLLTWWREHGHESLRWNIRRETFNTKWKRHATRAGCPHLTPHTLKRWWGARLIRSGATPWCVKFALDHVQNDVTGMHYLNPSDELAGLVDHIPLPASFTEVPRYDPTPKTSAPHHRRPNPPAQRPTEKNAQALPLSKELPTRREA